jgi:hypothetical protein
LKDFVRRDIRVHGATLGAPKAPGTKGRSHAVPSGFRPPLLVAPHALATVCHILRGTGQPHVRNPAPITRFNLRQVQVCRGGFDLPGGAIVLLRRTTHAGRNEAGGKTAADAVE